MLRLRDKAGLVEFKGAIEVDELYVNVGLKDKNNSGIKRLSKAARRRAFRRCGGGLWSYDEQTVFILVSRDEDYAPSSSVKSE